MTKRRHLRKGQDGYRLTEAQRKLAEEYVPLARAIAKPFKRRFAMHWEEFESAACMALVDAARRYDESRDIKFATFAKFRIRGAMAGVFRDALEPAYRYSGLKPPETTTLTPFLEQHGRYLGSTAPSRPEMETDDIDSFEVRIEVLPERYREVIRLYYLHGNQFDEIAEKIGVSSSEVGRRHRMGIKMLRPVYNDDGTPFVPGDVRKRRLRKLDPVPD
jgi:RNA polymerase sigma factor (sigma-70 family)